MYTYVIIKDKSHSGHTNNFGTYIKHIFSIISQNGLHFYISTKDVIWWRRSKWQASRQTGRGN